MTRRILLVLEFTALYVGLPLFGALAAQRVSPIPVLWGMALYALLVHRSFTAEPDRKALWSWAAFRQGWRGVIALFLPIAALFILGFWIYAPELLFGMVRKRPVIWMAVMILYPILSVLPQAIVYRLFIFTRYREIFRSPWALIIVSAVVFSFCHIIFRNPYAVILTVPAGLLFAWRYQRTGSLLLSAAEHALYGCFMFTVGLGEFFYHGASRAQ